MLNLETIKLKTRKFETYYKEKPLTNKYCNHTLDIIENTSSL